MEPTKKKMGRPKNDPSIHDNVKAEIICHVSNGGMLTEFCREPGHPARQTVYEWLAEDKNFAGQFARARQLGFDVIAEEALEIANSPMTGERTEESESGFKRIKEDMLGHRKLQIETRLKLLAKWDPKRYGELIKSELSGPGGGPVVIQASPEDEKL